MAPIPGIIDLSNLVTLASVDVKQQGYLYHFYLANQQKVHIKICSWTQCEISKNKHDWHILVANNQEWNHQG